MKVSLTVNGRDVTLKVSPRDSLLAVLRDQLDLTGTKPGCETGDCGACSVIVDQALVRSCLAKVSQLDGARITTIEGIHADDGGPSDLQQAFVDCGATQCGYCTPGMVIAAEVLLQHEPDPSREQIKQHLVKNLCRCTGYEQIFEAVELAAALRRKRGGARE